MGLVAGRRASRPPRGVLTAWIEQPIPTWSAFAASRAAPRPRGGALAAAGRGATTTGPVTCWWRSSSGAAGGRAAPRPARARRARGSRRQLLRALAGAAGRRACSPPRSASRRTRRPARRPARWRCTWHVTDGSPSAGQIEIEQGAEIGRPSLLQACAQGDRRVARGGRGGRLRRGRRAGRVRDRPVASSQFPRKPWPARICGRLAPDARGGHLRAAADARGRLRRRLPRRPGERARGDAWSASCWRAPRCRGEAVDDVILGQGYPNGEAPALGRVAALDAGLPVEVPGTAGRPPLRRRPAGDHARLHAGADRRRRRSCSRAARRA